MKFSRDDYDKLIQCPDNLIPVDEPVFLLRGQDPAAPGALEAWASLAELKGASDEMVASARLHASVMREWQQEHGSKVPDLPTSVTS